MNRMLAIDIGNTNITLGLFSGARLIRKASIPTAGVRSISLRIKRFCGGLVKTAVISSVVPAALAYLVPQIRRTFKCEALVIGKDIKVPIKNLYRNKHEVGQDRLVNAFAAKAFYGSPAVIIDFGTAITFDIVSRKGEYLGGVILPGISMSLASLYEHTALLPKVELKAAGSIIGKDTVNSMRGGILFGFGAMCDGLVSEYRKILGKDTKVIATGGNADLVRKYTRAINIVDDNLTLKGIAKIFFPPSVS